MKKLQIVSVIILIMTNLALLTHHFIAPFPDWLVRIVGVLLLAGIFCTVFSSVRITKQRN